MNNMEIYNVDPMNNMDIYNATKAVPEEAKTPITAGRLKGKTDINPMWRIKVLTEQFGPCGIGWYYKETKQWIETYGDEVCAFVNIEMFIKVNGEWSQPIFGTGGNMLAQKEKNGVYVSDECFKKATTDALSVACKQLGIGADVYFSSDRTKYDNQQSGNQEVLKTISQQMVQEISKEIDRTGIDVRRIVGTYNKKTLEELTEANYKDAMFKLRKMESIPPRAPDVLTEPEEYGGLPFR